MGLISLLWLIVVNNKIFVFNFRDNFNSRKKKYLVITIYNTKKGDISSYNLSVLNNIRVCAVLNDYFVLVLESTHVASIMWLVFLCSFCLLLFHPYNAARSAVNFLIKMIVTFIQQNFTGCNITGCIYSFSNSCYFFNGKIQKSRRRKQVEQIPMKKWFNLKYRASKSTMWWLFAFPIFLSTLFLVLSNLSY